MQPFQTFQGLVVPLDRTNVDTDQIIPKQFLKRIERQGFGECLFYHWRFNENGEEIKEFPLNQEKYKGAQILVAGPNFGCGSSREHAPWALQDYGFKVIIAPSFADIFYNNCLKNGLLPIQLNLETVKSLIDKANEATIELTVDLENERLTYDDQVIYFEMDPYQKETLLKGLDDIAITMMLEDKIASYEEKCKGIS
ncbi:MULTISPECIES: 3-isopropylmalate dehydratase small subunit [Heyndrickxia]|uniref:3-isopropylmalate dehydratase small subunit n=1 Tax=Heyndrickxia TaxID=2837504 RepID=UPI0015D3CB94|nr:3-isopropylmalate dehydratase small subunit [Heyndrickxia oleronia]NYV64190.1 3-isopropylmalate dehydratase small subunit [Bacillus sp. Gen3]MCI1591909.1 3-isopropylmalate dehydratase small subunit [Heyndrickxia oleronia]MCI1614566.1 3-isopropylmalate dehydratase small subunit [Heyndrickxia oleronia]MCI1743399.1 3-isopropylmalate dehydratase small subunit [Heyndrickxia oleronia]MCI1762326.1 3-isopropylmalate dehydratase small subunit [Heyndrickxia oleronia]